MQPPLWKKWLSHIYEFHIETLDSEVSEVLHVSLVNGQYQLHTANAIYSHGNLYSNFFRAFQKIKIQNYNIKNVLLLGLGMGSIPYMLEKNFNTNYHYVGIEKDESVVYLANKYVLGDLNSTFEYYTTDAEAYTFQCNRKFDMIALDIFIDDIIPEAFESLEFLSKVKELLTPNGLLLYNRLANTPSDIGKTKNFYNNNFIKIFKNGMYLDVGGNWILLNRKV